MIQGPYFFWQLSFVTSCRYSAAHVDGRLNGQLLEYDKRAEGSVTNIFSNKIMIKYLW